MFFIEIIIISLISIVTFTGFHGGKLTPFRGAMLISLVGILAVSPLYLEGTFLYVLWATAGMTYLLHRATSPKVIVVQYEEVADDKSHSSFDLRI